MSSPFSDYTELCKVPSQAWDWSSPSGLDVDAPRVLGVGDGSLSPAGLTDEDKLCFFERPSSRDAELKVPGTAGGISLGSAGDSPDSPLSSSPSPSPASPGRMPSALGCGGISRGSGPPPPPPLTGSTLTGASLSPVDGRWDSSSPKVAMPQVAPNYCVIGVANDNHLEEEEGAAALGTQQLSSGDNSDEEELEEEEELEPCFMGRAQQQRKAMRRAMSECSHLSVPTCLELPDKYPGGDGAAGLDQLASPTGGGPRRSPHSMKRSLTVAEDQPPTPPPTLSAAGATHIDLRQSPPEPRLLLSPSPPRRDDDGGGASMDGFRVEKEPEGIVLPVPLSPKAFSSSAEETGLKPGLVPAAGLDSGVHTGADGHLGSGNTLTLAAGGGGGGDGDLATGGYSNLGLNPFISVDGRWSSCLQAPLFSFMSRCCRMPALRRHLIGCFEEYVMEC